MNKVFKVIWNHATQTWTAVSELGHAKGKTKSKKIVKLTALAGAVIGSLAVSQTATAAVDLGTDDAVNIAANNVPNRQVGREAIAVGQNAGATHQHSIAIGRNATANWTNTISIGKDTTANKDHAVAIGTQANATGIQSLALGSETVSSHDATIAIGKTAQATKSAAIAMGSLAQATGDNSIYIGTINPNRPGSGSTGTNSIGIGPSVKSHGLSSVAIGGGSEATKDQSIAMGRTAKATAEDATAIGYNANASANNATAIGREAVASADNSVAQGAKAKATGTASFAGGTSANASGANSIAIGGSMEETGESKAAQAVGKNSIAHGIGTVASQTADIAIGANSKASGSEGTNKAGAAIAIGANANATNISAVALGEQANATANGAVAVGSQANAKAGSAAAFGRGSNASGESSTALGSGAKAQGQYSFAGAPDSNASGINSVAIGAHSKANINDSVALGADSETTPFVKAETATVGSITYSGFAGVTSALNGGAGSVVSVGKAGSERQIKNVAAGVIRSNSTDAINGSQLYSVADALATEIKKQHWNVGNNEGAVVNGVYHEDQVNFVNGNVTTVKVVKAPSKSSTPDGGPNITNVSYDVNVGQGLKIKDGKIITNIAPGKGVTFDKDETSGEITINAQSTGGAASSVVSGDNNTLSVKQNATNPSEYIVTPITGSLSISKDEKGKVGDDAKGNEDNGKKLTTIQTTRDMINKAHWNLQIGTSSDPKNAGESEITSADQNAEPIHAGDTVNFFAGKNVKLKRQGSDITISAADTAVDKGEIIPATNTTNTNNNGTVMAKDGDGDKFANITNVVNAINSAFWKIGEENSGTVTAKGNVTAGSQVNFSNGVGTIAKVTADEANKTYKVQYDINAGPGIEIPATGDNKGKVTVKVDNSTVTINDDGQLVANSAWNANATGNVDGTSAAKAVKANATVNFDAGENLKVKQTGDAANQVYSFSLNQTLTNITSIQNKATGPKLTFGDNSINITGGNLNMGGNKITNLEPGTDETDAVNLAQLKASRTVVTSTDKSVKVTPSKDGLTNTYDLSVDLSKLDLSKAKSSWNVKSSAADGGAVAANHNATEKNIADKNTVEFKAGKNLTVEQVNGDTGANVTFALNDNITLGKDGKDGKDGSIGVTGKDGAAVAINGKDGSIGLTGPKGADGKDGASVTIKPEKGTTTVAERDGGKDINRVTYTDKDKDGNDIKREIATLDDGLKFKGDDNETVNRTLGSTLNITGGAADSTTVNNIRVTKADDGGLKVNLANNVTLNNDGSLNIGGTTVKDGDIQIGNTHITKDGAVTNLTTHLNDPVKVTDSVTNATKTADLASNLTTPTAADYRGKDAATVEDVLKAGWNLQANGKAVDAVTHGNNVNFASDGSVKITPTTDGNNSTLNLSVNATNVVKQVTGNVSANTTTGKAVVGKDGVEDTDPNAGNKVATVGDVANTINNAGWITKATDGTNVTVNPGDRVEYVDGKGTKANVTVTNTNGQDVVNVTYDVKTDGTTITVKDGNVTANTGEIIKAEAEGDDAGKVTVKTGDDNKVATVKNVADAINSAGWIVNTGKAADQNAFKTETGTATKVGAGDKVNFQAGKNLEVKREGDNIIYATSEDLEVTTVKVGKDGKDGKDGSIGVTGKDGAAVAINGKDGSIGLTGPKGADGKDGASVTIKPEKGTTTVAERDGGKDINRVTYTDKDKDGNDIKREIATLDDGLKFKGDDNETVNRTLGSTLNITGGAADSTTVNNIRVTKADDGGLKVNLANNVTLNNDGSLNIGGTTVKDGDIQIGDTHITNGAVTNLTHHIENPTTVVDSDVLNITDDKKKDAATVRDVLNSGWNLQANGEAVDAVTHGNTVNFASDGSVKITPTTDGNTSTLNLSVNATNVVKQVTGNVSANTTTGKAVVGKDGVEDTDPNAGNKVATVGDVANTINNAGWITKATDGTNVTVNPGDRVEYVDGKGTKANVTVTNTNGQDVVNVTYDVKTDGTTITVKDGNVTANTGEIIKAEAEGDDAGKVTVKTGDDNKVATVKNVADAINSAGWIVNTGKAADQNAFKTETGTATKVGAGDKVNFQAGKNLEVKREGQNIIYATSEDLDAKTITVTTVKVGNDGKDGKDGVDGSIGVTGKDGAAVAINGKDGSIGLTGPKGADGKDGASVTIKPEKGTTTVAERDGGKDINRVTYTDKDKDGNDIKREIATLDDGLKFTGDDGQTVNRTLGSNLNVKGGAADSTTAKNIRVTKAADGEGLDVNLANNIKLDNDGSLNIGGTTVKDGDIKIGDTHITNGAVTNLTHHIENPTTVVDDNVLNITDDKKKDAATVRDVLNSGWNLQANGKAVDAVTHGNNVNFASDKGTVTVTANSDGKTSVVNLDVNVDNDTISVNEKGQLVASGATNFNVATKDGGNKVAKKGGSSTTKITSGKTITYTAGKNIAIEQNGGDILVSTTEDLDQNSVTTNNLTVKEGGNVTVGPNSTVNMGGNQVHNVKAGTADTDAVNVSQLRSNVTHLNNRINKVGKEARGGIAGANAAAGLPQVYIPGKSMVAASAGTFKGESALAVGYSRSSDNGKVIFKLQGNANTQGDVGGSVGVGYQW